MEKYTIQANENNPLLLTLTLDRSGSTNRKFPDGTSIAEVIAKSADEAVEEIQAMCSSREKIKDKIFLHVLGYGDRVETLLCEPIGAIKPLRQFTEQQNYDGVTIDVEKSVFVEPHAAGRTPMHDAFETVYKHIDEAYSSNPQSPAAVVINISDGMPNNIDKSTEIAERLQVLEVQDGQTLLFNAHVDHTGQAPIFFPVNENELPTEYAKFMFRISSALPASFIEYSNETSNGLPEIKKGAKAMIFNASGAELLKLIQLGTRASK